MKLMFAKNQNRSKGLTASYNSSSLQLKLHSLVVVNAVQECLHQPKHNLTVKNISKQLQLIFNCYFHCIHLLFRYHQLLTNGLTTINL